MRLFSLLAGGGWTMLRYEAAGPSVITARPGLRIVDIGTDNELRDEQGHLREAYGYAPGDVALIRPDGYIGVLTSDERSPALATYLERAGMAPSRPGSPAAWSSRRNWSA